MPTLSVDFGGTAIKVGVVADGELSGTTEFVSTSTPRDLERTEHEARALIGDGAIAGVGIAVPGIVDRRRGTLAAAHGKQGYLHGRDLRSWARERFGVPAEIENDGRAALLGEVTYGVARGETDVVSLSLGTGIGTAALIGGRLLRGAHDHAGVLGGHLTTDLFGERCNCGNLGCGETVGGSWALPGRIRRRLAVAPDAAWEARIETADYRLVFERAADGDPFAIALRDEALLAWGATATNLCHAYDPDVLVLAGGVLRAGALVPEAIERHQAAFMWSSAHRPRVVVAARPEFSVLLGLAVLAREAAETRGHGGADTTPTQSPTEATA
ncbi:ROK family protein [Microbacterium album]|uniref:Glucokinase n=1 Tax=Microbacterium album TaxID=2053191 RepID=A0A917MQ60_9MICO|nr:ROK family protein [Microbacterium album]GGH50165.1 glucokinase [Microbacterium album]